VGRSALTQAPSNRNDKRSSGLDVCSCLQNANQCLDSQSCSDKTGVLATLCNWNAGRTFGTCPECAGITTAIYEGDAIAGEIIAQFDELATTVATSVPVLVSDIASVVFHLGSKPNSYTVDVTLSAGVVSADVAYNKMVYQLSRIFDVTPGTFSWAPVSAKRQTSTIELTVIDEDQSSGASALFVPLGLVLVMIQTFF